MDIYAVGELDMKGVAMMTIFCRLIFLLFPSSTLYFVAGLKALAYVVVSFVLSFELSMLEMERAGKKWSR